MLLLIFVFLLLTWLFWNSRKPKNFPPGPPRLPMIGFLPYMAGSGPRPSLLHGIIDQVKKHGPIFGFYFGGTPAVVIADYHLIKEAYKNDQLSHRPDMRPFNEARPGWQLVDHENYGRLPGIVLSHGRYWKELRRFLLRNLRDFGFGKSSMENLFHEEMAKLCLKLAKNAGQPTELVRTMDISIINALWAILVGERIDLDDPNLAELVRVIEEFLHSAAPVSPIAAALPHPAMGKLPILRDLIKFGISKKATESILKVIEPIIKAHRQTLDHNNIRDFLDVMLIEAESKQDPQSPLATKLASVTIKNSIIDMVLAGMETTSSSLLHIFLHLLHHPDIQDKVHKELDAVVGRNRYPSLTDRDNLPYVNAVLLESLRSATLAFVFIPHAAAAEVKLRGYTIPKRAMLMASLWHVHHDPEHFKDPETFNPDRFIDSNGRFINDERVIPFGIGKRICIAQSMAEKQLFIFFTGIMQQFRIRPAPGFDLPSYQEIYPEAMLRTAPPYKLVLEKRF